MTSNEVIISSDQSGQLWNTCIWDLESGTQLYTLKGEASAPNTLCVVNDNLIMNAMNDKPLIYIWSLNKKDQVHMKIVTVGKIGCMSVTPDGNYCIASIENRIYVWQMATGDLLAVLTQHYQDVSVLKFLDDGSFFISGGMDNVILIWNLAHVINESRESSSTTVKPWHTWSGHSLPITDIYTGCGGLMAHVASVSLDQTCKIWELRSKELLCTLVFDHSLTSVVLDNSEDHVYVGTSVGLIYQVELFDRNMSKEKHISSDKDDAKIFSGHSKQVNLLQISMAANILVSGSLDANIRVWDIASRQCIRVLPHKGPITNLLVSLKPPLNQPKAYKNTTIIAPFKRQIVSSGQDESGSEKLIPIFSKCIPNNQVNDFNKIHKSIHFLNQNSTVNEEKKVNLENRVTTLEKSNKELYAYTIDKILNSNES